MNKIRNVYVSSSGINKMPDAYAKSITVSSNSYYFQFWIGQFCSNGKRKSSTMQCVDPVGIHEVRHFRVAPNARENGHFVMWQLQLSKSQL